jgi:hypothetical protein
VPDGSPIIELANPGLLLDLTTSPWLLGPGRSRMIRGRDVIHAGRIGPEGGLKPVGCSISAADRPLTSVIECAYSGRVPVRWSMIYDDDHIKYVDSTTLRLFYGAAWRDEMVGGFVGISPVYPSGGATTDQGRYLWELKQVTAISEVNYADDTLTVAPAMSFEPIAGIQKLWIDYQITVNRNGILVSNGRKFWLLQGGTYYQVMDLGSDDYLGVRWRGSMISTDRMMLTADQHPPRLFFFRDDLPNAATADAESYAGLGTPVKPAHKEPDYTEPPVPGNNPSWVMTAGGGGTGSLSAGDYRVYVRAVNLIDGSQSRMVRVFENTSPRQYDFATVPATGSLLVNSTPFNGNASPCPYDPKWTHLEIWRSEADGSEFYLEGRIPLIQFANEYRANAVVAGNTGTNSLLSLDTTYYERPCRISDADLVRRDALTVTDILAGYRPPVCREAVNIQGVTICAGKAASDADPYVSQYAYGYFCLDVTGLGTQYDHATRRMTYVGSGTVFSGYTDYTAGDEFVIVSCSNPLKVGAYPLASRVSDAVLEFAAPGPGENLTNITGYLRRAYRIKSEVVSADEDVWYSRTDQYSPESFLTRTLRLSNRGDVFRALRAVGRYAAVIMADGVHLLYLTTDLSGSIVLDKHTVASNGAGTPWADSVAVWERNVVWATRRGPVVMRVSDDSDDTGARAQIASLDENGAFQSWFEEADRAGEDIDTGVDTENQTIRFRRHKTGGVQEVLQFCWRTRLWTLLYDTGFLYARSLYADSTELASPRAYSVNTDGSVFEVNYQGLDHPYDGVTLQVVTDSTYTVTTTRITKAGEFSTYMLGDLVYFRKAGAAYDGTWRKITACTADYIEFATVTGLAAGAEFIIQPCQFRFRTAPVVGRNPRQVKTLSGLIVRARPGLRATDGNWGVPSGTPLTVRTYRNHYDGAAMDESLQELPVYEESDVSKDDQDPVSAAEAQGFAFEVEVECLEARSDFLLETIAAAVDEEGANEVDASSTA